MPVELEKAQVDLSSVCEALKAGCKQGWTRLFSVVPGADTMGINWNAGGSLWASGNIFYCGSGTTGCPGRWCSLSLPMEILKAGWTWSWVAELKLTLLEPGVCWKGWPSEVLSNLLQCVILWTLLEVYTNSPDAEGPCGNARLGSEGD